MSLDQDSSGRRRGERRAPRPLDTAALERLALHYVGRFATTRARLADYLTRKIRERGWEGAAADVAALAERLSALGYIDDLAFGEARAAAMARRGLGARRVRGTLRHAGVTGDDVAALDEAIDSRRMAAAITFARRKRIGPFATVLAELAQREKQIAAMIRAGHDPVLARTIATMTPGDDVEALV